LIDLGFMRLNLCPSTYVRREMSSFVIVFCFVDDFVFTGNDESLIKGSIEQWRGVATTTEPIENASKLLGMEVKRVENDNTIYLTLTKKIEEVVERYHPSPSDVKRRNSPIGEGDYLIKEQQYEKLPEELQRKLSDKEIKEYMGIVGSLIWIVGIRYDISFAVSYLSWYTKEPLVHHMKVAIRVVEYLHTTKDVPLILGGKDDDKSVLKLVGITDASVGTAPKGRSVIGNMLRIGNVSGCVWCKSTKSNYVHTSSYESELEGILSVIKACLWIRNIIVELGIPAGVSILIKNDNQKAIEFCKGLASARNTKHMDLVIYKIIEYVKSGQVDIEYEPGEELLADKLTKVTDINGFKSVVHDMLGLTLVNHEIINPAVLEIYDGVCLEPKCLDKGQGVSDEGQSMRR